MKNFEERLARLEQLTQLVKAPQTPLSDAVAGFEEGFKLAQALEKDLEKMEKRVEVLLNPPGPGTAPAEAPEASFDLFSDLPKVP
jgi:exodeoxyribonuclease VII small subunit